MTQRGRQRHREGGKETDRETKGERKTDRRIKIVIVKKRGKEKIEIQYLFYLVPSLDCGNRPQFMKKYNTIPNKFTKHSKYERSAIRGVFRGEQ